MKNDHKLDTLKQQKSILSQFCRSEVQSQGVRVPCFLWRLQGRILATSSSFWDLLAFLGLWLLHSNLCICLPMAFSLCLCLLCFKSSLTFLLWEHCLFSGPTRNQYDFISLWWYLQRPFPQIRSGSRFWGVGTWKYLFWKTLFNPLRRCYSPVKLGMHTLLSICFPEDPAGRCPSFIASALALCLSVMIFHFHLNIWVLPSRVTWKLPEGKCVSCKMPNAIFHL